MPRRSARRFVLEVLFLAGVAAAVTVADLKPLGVIALMGLAWVVVALAEWTAWLDEPHYGRGLPPRFYVPQTALPPPRAVPQGRPYAPPVRPAAPRVSTPGVSPDDAPTFVAQTAAWDVDLAEWPALDSGLEEETVIATPAELADEPVPLVQLPPVLAIEETVEHRVVFDEDDEPTVDPEAEPAPQTERRPEHAAGVVAAAAFVAEEPAAVVPRPARAPAPRPVEPGRPPVPLIPPPAGRTVTTHRVDPLAGLGRGRFRLRRGGEEAVVEVEDGPPSGRKVPERVLQQAQAARQ